QSLKYLPPSHNNSPRGSRNHTKRPPIQTTIIPALSDTRITGQVIEARHATRRRIQIELEICELRTPKNTIAVINTGSQERAGTPLLAREDRAIWKNSLLVRAIHQPGRDALVCLSL